MSPFAFHLKPIQGPWGSVPEQELCFGCLEKLLPVPGQSVGLPRKALLIHKHPWKGERYPGNYFKFISAIKCNCAHTADESVLGKLSLAHEVLGMLCWWHPPELLGGSRKGLPQTEKGHYIIFRIHIFLTEAVLHRGRVFPLGCWIGGNEGCPNGRGLAALTLHTHTVGLGCSHGSGPAMSPLGWQNLSRLLRTPCGLLSAYGHLTTAAPSTTQTQFLSLMLKSS